MMAMKKRYWTLIGLTSLLNDSKFCDILAPIFDTDPRLYKYQAISQLSVEPFENETIDKHITDTFVNICCFVLEVFIIIPIMVFVIYYKMKCFGLFFHVITQVTVKCLFIVELPKFKFLQKF